MSASDVIKIWNDLAEPSGHIRITITGTQGGTVFGGGMPVAFFSTGVFKKVRKTGELKGPPRAVLLSDRGFRAGYVSEFTLMPNGVIREHNRATGSTQDVELKQAESSLVLTGWGDSVGTTGVECFWVVVASNRSDLPEDETR